nr:ABC transporter ATP-binding protein [Candidatus Acidoferrales bacterium]
MIEVEQIRKKYKDTEALAGFSLRVADGELFGLIGPNGAGKSTLMKILATLIHSSDGRASIAGIDVARDPKSVKRVVGYMPDQPGLYQEMRVREFLEFFAAAFAVPKDKQRAAVEKALERSNLAERSQSFVEELSFGMKQRLVLAKTLLHEPKLLILDEPATGLDPIARIDLREQLKKLNAEGVTIFISSHILSDLEDICDRVALITAGKNAADAEGQSVLVLQSPASQLRIYEIDFLGDSAFAAARAGEAPGVRVLENSQSRLLAEIEGTNIEAAKLLQFLVMAGVVVTRFDHPAPSLERRYRQAFGTKQP